jgi:nucleotide-binding universal stress UspA family protein
MTLGPPMLNLRAILVAADFSGCSEDAFQVARALARDYGARLTMLHVATPPPFVTPGELQKLLAGPDGYRGALEDRLRQVYPAAPPTAAQYLLRDGDPATEIVEAARAGGCDLIVMGTHGRTGLRRVLMGGVAEAVVRRAPCPVLTVRRPDARAPHGDRSP